MSGYSVEMFKEFNQNWLCVICFEAYRHPQRFPCGHCLCLDCCLPLLETDRPCPTCRAPIQKSAVVHDLSLQGDIDKALVFCLHKDFGCDATVPLAELNAHSAACMAKPQQCKDCGYKACSLRDHTPSDCVYNFKVMLSAKNAQLLSAETIAEQRRHEVITALNEKDIAIADRTIAERETQVAIDALRVSEDDQRAAVRQRDRMVDLTVEQDITIKEYEEDILFYTRQNTIMLQSVQLKEAHINDLERRLARYNGRPTPYGGTRPARRFVETPNPSIVIPDRNIPSPAYSFSDDAGDESM